MTLEQGVPVNVCFWAEETNRQLRGPDQSCPVSLLVSQAGARGSLGMAEEGQQHLMGNGEESTRCHPVPASPTFSSRSKCRGAEKS